MTSLGKSRRTIRRRPSFTRGFKETAMTKALLTKNYKARKTGAILNVP